MTEESSSAPDLGRRATDPRLIRRALVQASFLLAAWEILKSSVIDRTRSFFHVEYRDGAWVVGEDYETDVLALARHPFEASLRWLARMGAISQADIPRVQRIRRHRNEVAHELPMYAIGWGVEIDTELLVLTRHYVFKVSNFWARLEFEGDPDVPPDTDFSTAKSGGVVLLDHMLEILEELQGV